MQKIIILFSFLTSFGQLTAQNLLINNSEGNLLNFNTDGCSTSTLSNIGSFTDIAAHLDGFLYGIKANGQIYQINAQNGNASFAISLPGDGYYALTSDADGNIFGASGGGTLASYNPTTNMVTTYPNMGYGAAGDLTFYQGQMYMATTDNTIVSIHPDSPEENEVFIDFSSANATIFGIVSAVNGCEVITYAFSNDNSAKVFQIDWINQTFNLVCTIPHRIYGGSSTFEFNASASLIPSTITTSNTGCDQPETLIEIDATSANGGVVYSLDGENFQSENIFQNLDFGTYTLYMEDAAGCEETTNFTLEPGELAAEIIALPTTCGATNGAISIAATSNAETISYSLDNAPFQNSGDFSDLEATDYQVVIQDEDGCEINETVTVEANLAATISNIQTTPTACNLNNGSFTFTAENDNMEFSLDGENYTNATTFEDLAAGNYTLYVIDEDACSSTQMIEILESEQSCDLYIPNIFSPNDDGVNDVFRVYSETDYAIQKMQIFSRWGELIFEATDFSSLDQTMRWDGTFRGKIMGEGVYIYQIIYAAATDTVIRAGDVSLLR